MFKYFRQNRTYWISPEIIYGGRLIISISTLSTYVYFRFRY